MTTLRGRLHGRPHGVAHAQPRDHSGLPILPTGQRQGERSRVRLVVLCYVILPRAPSSATRIGFHYADTKNKTYRVDKGPLNGSCKTGTVPMLSKGAKTVKAGKTCAQLWVNGGCR
ncbi:hypothetical protein ACIQU6_15470 [Streptomyces sp. NPDC090442]|uniref:hypothetical protein n=1 Tax=Streptomyces sp. NPDC090442 TaxID=3365962 RepID=UPI0038127098